MNWIKYKEENRGVIISTVIEIINEERLDEDSRVTEHVHRRYFLMWFLRRHTKLTFEEIGEMFSKNYSSVMSGVNKHIENIEDEDKVYMKNILMVKNYLKTQAI